MLAALLLPNMDQSSIGGLHSIEFGMVKWPVMHAENEGMAAYPSKVASAAAYWNPSDKSASIGLSVGDTVATYTAGTSYGSVRGVTFRGSGKYYFEVLVNAMNSSFIGIANSSFVFGTDFVGKTVDGFGYFPPGNVIYNNGSVICNSFANGDVLMFAYDVTNGNLWVGINGVWEAGGNPGAGTGAQYTATTIGSCTPCFSGGTNADNITLRTASGDFGYGIPSGFSAWG